MSAKISMAFDENYNMVHIKDAVKKRTYYCLNCREELFPSKGKVNVHHYRHYSKVESKALLECELYSSSNSDYSVLINEKGYENNVRFILDSSYNLHIRFPYLDKENIVKMNSKDLYFTIEIENNSLFSSYLGKENSERTLYIPFRKQYEIKVNNQLHANQLNYSLDNQINLMSNSSLLFKKVGKEYINIPYSKTNLSETIYLLSSRKLFLHHELTQYGFEMVEGYYLYHLIVGELTESLIQWFKRETGYTIIPHRKWLDIVEPSTFKYSKESILIEDEQVKLSITKSSRNDMVSVTNDFSSEKLWSSNEEELFEIPLKKNQTYLIKISNELANELIIKRVDRISPRTSFTPSIYINNSRLEKISAYTFSDQNLKVFSNLKFQLFNESNYPFWLREFKGLYPDSIHFPFLGTIHRKSNELDFGIITSLSLYLTNQYMLVKNSEYKSVLNYIKRNKIRNKHLILSILTKRYNKLPRDIINHIRKEGI